MRLYGVLTFTQGDLVHWRIEQDFLRAEDYFRWKSSCMSPTHPKWPADLVKLVNLDVTVVNEKGAAQTAPRVARPDHDSEHAKIIARQLP